MADKMVLHFVFQGGGARLGSLLAAVAGIHEAAGSADANFKIGSASGTSAGAIAACVLATGEAPDRYISAVRTLGPSSVRKIQRRRGVFGAAWRIWRGLPLYDMGEYKTFLGEIFGKSAGRRLERLRDIQSDIECYIHCTDIRDGSQVVHSRAKNPDGKIVDLLADSSAIPFYFRSFKGEPLNQDGGLIDNFPTGTILGELAKVQGSEEVHHVVGISFAAKRTVWEIKNLKSYITMLISTVLEYPVKLAASRILEEDRFEIVTDTTTFDFTRALTHDMSPAEFDRLRDQVRDFLGLLVRRKASANAGMGFAGVLNRLVALHAEITRRQSMRIVKEVIEYRCDSLRKDSNLPIDTVKGRLSIRSERDNMRAFSIGYMFDTRHWTIRDIGVSLHDESGAEVFLTAVPLNPEPANDFMFRVRYLLFFHETLRVGETYQLRFNSEVSDALVGLAGSGRKDIIIRRNVEAVTIEEQLTIAYIPETLGDLQIVDCFASDRIEEAVWKSGVPLSQAEIRRIGDVPMGYSAIGWRVGGGEGHGEGLRRGESAGFTVLRP